MRSAHAEISAMDLELTLHGLEIARKMRPVLSRGQQVEAMEFMAEVLSGAQLRYADFRGKFAAGELLGRKWSSSN